jgi:RNA polymerase sigma factor (sigma-70 family)
VSNFSSGGHYWDKKRMTQDAALLTQYVETRSEAAFRELVDRHLNLVYGAALRHLDGDTHAAHDVAQNVFVLLARKARDLRSHPSLAGWLYRAAHFESREMNRSERRRRARDAAVVALHEPAVDSLAGADDAELGRNITELVLDLSVRDREAVLLRYFEQLSFAEIAHRLALSEAAAHKRVERALERLRDRLAARGIVSTATALAATLNAQSGISVPAGLATGITTVATAAPLASAGLLGVFNLTTLTWGVAALASVLAVTLALQDSAKFGQLSRAAADSQRESAALLDQIRGLKDKLAALESDHAADDANNSPLQMATEPAPPRETGGATATISADTQMLEQDAQVRTALRQMADWDNVHYFGPLLAAAGVAPAQIRRAEAVLGENMKFSGFGPQPMSLATGSREIDAEIRGIVGPAGVAAINSYLIQRQAIEGLAGTLYNTDSPLTEAQAAQLKQVLVDTNHSHGTGAWYAPQDTDWTKAVAAAQAFLTPVQIDHLRMLAAMRFGGPGR